MKQILPVLLLFMAGCGNPAEKIVGGNQLENSSQLQEEATKTSSIQPAMVNTDSLEIIYYDNPDGDSLRYTRFYRYFASNDTAIIGPLLAALAQPYQQLSQVKKCRSQGKIHLYANQEPIKTIYFSTRCDTCCYAYLIKDGSFLYFPMQDSLKNILLEKKGKAIKP